MSNQPIDHIIFVGFDPVDRSTGKGSRAMKIIMDAMDVRLENIHFYPGETKATEIIRKSFIKDDSQKFGYQIGNSICIGSDKLTGVQGHSLNRLKKVGIVVRNGCEDIDFTALNESEMSRWLKTGHLGKSDKNKTQNKESESDDADLDNSLLFFGEDDKDTDYKSYDDLTTGMKERTDTSTVETEGFDPNSNELFAENTDKFIDNEMNYRENLLNSTDPLQTLANEQAGITREDDELKDYSKQRDNLEKFGNSSFVDSDDVEGSILKQRQQMEQFRREEAEREAKNKSDNGEELTEEQKLIMAGMSFDPEKDIAGKSEIVDKRASSLVEQRYNPDGTRKTYKEYLSPQDQKRQEVMERTAKEFGTDVGGKDTRYVSKDTGRIILVSSGKGGVGKSLVSNGMAAALSLARAKDMQNNPGASTSRTWLIESDYNSPQLAIAYKTGKRNIGRIAEVIANEAGAGVNNEAIRKAIEDNAYVDEDTGVHILACPPLSTRRSSREIPMAILFAIRYASEQGDDVIIDHGNLTSGEYSELDYVISMKLAHRIVIVSNMMCIPETQSVLSLLCDREAGTMSSPLPPACVSVVLNSARKEQYYIAQEKLSPYKILNIIPPIDAFRAENSLTGSVYLCDATPEVQKAVIDRCGIVMSKLGYESLERFFPGNFSRSSLGGGRSGVKTKGLLGKITGIFAK